ncbi:MAG: hypothetical protein K2P59_01950 [Acetatifactor sp.]|nr:hypothetical protein [Acetatifactor sp.]
MGRFFKRIVSVCIVINLVGIIFLYTKFSDWVGNGKKDRLLLDNRVERGSMKKQRGLLTDTAKEALFRIQTDSPVAGVKDICMTFPTVDAEYIPERGYDLHICVERGRAYVCWGDMLIVGDTVYKREGQIYKKTGESLEDFFPEAGKYDDVVQYENFLITTDDIEGFVVYDMDSGELFRYPCYYVAVSWYVYDGKIYYHDYNDNNSIFSIDLLTGKCEEIYECKDFFEFMMRNDGVMMAEISEDSTDTSAKEYWLIYSDMNGRYTSEKIWEQSKYTFTELFEFNEYGLFMQGNYYEGGTPADDILCLKDSGKTEDVTIRIAGTIITEKGYYRWDSLREPEAVLDNWNNLEEKYVIVDSVTYYDFQGNKIKTYCLIDDKWLDIGYQLEAFIYNKGYITAFYVCEDRDELYISRIQVE